MSDENDSPSAGAKPRFSWVTSRELTHAEIATWLCEGEACGCAACDCWDCVHGAHHEGCASKLAPETAPSCRCYCHVNLGLGPDLERAPETAPSCRCYCHRNSLNGVTSGCQHFDPKDREATPGSYSCVKQMEVL